MDVSTHYNKHRPRQSETSKEMLGIRNFHNFVKAKLLASACSTTVPHARMLDLCCGNGGDITKLKHNDINEYIGMDIANQAVERALQKLSEHPEVKGDVLTFNAFSVTAGNMLQNMKPFDIVSCQFAIHYAFSDERTARTFIQNVAFSLRVGGSFIITVPDFYHLAKSKKLLGKKFGDEIYSVKFASHEEIQDFGTAYEFSFKGAVENLTEFVVNPGVLISLCKEVGMQLVESKNFSEYATHKGESLWTRMGVTYNEVSRIYRTYHFKMEQFDSDDWF
tara:strand:- start:2039 stop:2872 length:834 start_codon:yes stop_codon:yes gene_type:complete